MPRKKKVNVGVGQGIGGGCPPLFKEPEELRDKILEYFDSEKDNNKITITGLALHLGFCSRQSFYDYEKHEKFSYIIRNARLRVENSYEISLRDDGAKPTGAIFALKNMGWEDKQTQNHTGDVPKFHVTFNNEKESNDE